MSYQSTTPDAVFHSCSDRLEDSVVAASQLLLELRRKRIDAKGLRAAVVSIKLFVDECKQLGEDELPLHAGTLNPEAAALAKALSAEVSALRQGPSWQDDLCPPAVRVQRLCNEVVRTAESVQIPTFQADSSAQSGAEDSPTGAGTLGSPAENPRTLTPWTTSSSPVGPLTPALHPLPVLTVQQLQHASSLSPASTTSLSPASTSSQGAAAEHLGSQPDSQQHSLDDQRGRQYEVDGVDSGDDDTCVRDQDSKYNNTHAGSSSHDDAINHDPRERGDRQGGVVEDMSTSSSTAAALANGEGNVQMARSLSVVVNELSVVVDEEVTSPLLPGAASVARETRPEQELEEGNSPAEENTDRQPDSERRFAGSEAEGAGCIDSHAAEELVQVVNGSMSIVVQEEDGRVGEEGEGEKGGDENEPPTPPEEYLCPVSWSLMHDPVVIESGQTYERAIIVNWFLMGNRSCPVTGQKVNSCSVTPNWALKRLILHWCQQHGVEQPEQEQADGEEEDNTNTAEQANTDSTGDDAAAVSSAQTGEGDQPISADSAVTGGAEGSGGEGVNDAVDPAGQGPLVGVNTAPSSDPTRPPPGAILAAAEEHNLVGLRRLIAAGGDVSEQDAQGQTALHFAAVHNSKPMIECLLRAGASTSTRNMYTLTPLMTAVLTHKNEAVETLLENGASVFASCGSRGMPLHGAAAEGNLIALSLLLKWYAPLEACDENGNTPLALACKNRQSGAVRILLDAGASTETPNYGNYTPLYHAIVTNHLSIVHMLLDAGATGVCCVPPDTLHALHVAASEGFEDVTEILLSHPRFAQDVHRFDHFSLRLGSEMFPVWVVGTPLHAAACNGFVGTLKLLLQYGAVVDAHNRSHRMARGTTTPLMCAALFGHKEVVQELLDAGADPCFRDRFGYTALHSAVENGHEEVVTLLLERGAKVCALPPTSATQDENDATVLPAGEDLRQMMEAVDLGWTDVMVGMQDPAVALNPDASDVWLPLHAELNAPPRQDESAAGHVIVPVHVTEGMARNMWDLWQQGGGAGEAPVEGEGGDAAEGREGNMQEEDVSLADAPTGDELVDAAAGSERSMQEEDVSLADAPTGDELVNDAKANECNSQEEDVCLADAPTGDESMERGDELMKTGDELVERGDELKEIGETDSSDEAGTVRQSDIDVVSSAEGDDVENVQYDQDANRHLRTDGGKTDNKDVVNDDSRVYDVSDQGPSARQHLQSDSLVRADDDGAVDAEGGGAHAVLDQAADSEQQLLLEDGSAQVNSLKQAAATTELPGEGSTHVSSTDGTGTPGDVHAALLGEESSGTNAQGAEADQPSSTDVQVTGGEQPSSTDVCVMQGEQPSSTDVLVTGGEQPCSTDAQVAEAEESSSTDVQVTGGEQPSSTDVQVTEGEQPSSTDVLLTDLDALEVNEASSSAAVDPSSKPWLCSSQAVDTSEHAAVIAPAVQVSAVEGSGTGRYAAPEWCSDDDAEEELPDLVYDSDESLTHPEPSSAARDQADENEDLLVQAASMSRNLHVRVGSDERSGVDAPEASSDVAHSQQGGVQEATPQQPGSALSASSSDDEFILLPPPPPSSPGRSSTWPGWGSAGSPLCEPSSSLENMPSGVSHSSTTAACSSASSLPPTSSQNTMTSSQSAAGAESAARDADHHASAGNPGSTGVPPATAGSTAQEAAAGSTSSQRYCSVLGVAASKGNTKMVRLLLKAGAPPDDFTPDSGLTPLHMACEAERRLQGSCAEVVKLLIQQGADPNAPAEPPGLGFRGRPRRPLAAIGQENNTTTITQAPNDRSPWPLISPLQRAIRTGALEVIEVLLDGGAHMPPQVLHDLICPNPPGAASGRRWGRAYRHRQDLGDLAHLLLRRGADVNYRNGAGRTPLLAAAWACAPDSCGHLIQVLLAQGADVFCRDTEGLSALDYATLCVNHKAASLLIAAGARPSITTKYSTLLLLCVTDTYSRPMGDGEEDATLGGYPSMGVNLDGGFAEEKARSFRAARLAEVLLEEDVTTQLEHRAPGLEFTPLHAAAAGNNLMLVRALVARGADVNARDKHGNTPLHYTAAVCRGCNRMVQTLLELGADPTAANDRGLQPMHLLLASCIGAAALETTAKPDGSSAAAASKGSVWLVSELQAFELLGGTCENFQAALELHKSFRGLGLTMKDDYAVVPSFWFWGRRKRYRNSRRGSTWLDYDDSLDWGDEPFTPVRMAGTLGSLLAEFRTVCSLTSWTLMGLNSYAALLAAVYNTSSS